MAKSDLRVGISADSSKFDKAMADVRNSLSKTKQDTKKSTDDVSKDYDALSKRLESALDSVSGGMVKQFKEGYDIAKNIANVMGSFKTVELFKGGFEGLKETFSGMFDGLSTNLAKTATQSAAVSSATSAMTQSLTSAGGAAVVAGNGVKGFSEAMGKVEYIRNAQTNIENLKQAYTDLEYNLAHVQSALEASREALTGWSLADLVSDEAKIKEQMDSTAESIKKAEAELAALGKTGKSLGQTMEGIGDKMIKPFKSLANAIKHPKETWGSFQSAIKSGCQKAGAAISSFSVKAAAKIALATAGISLLVTGLATVVASLGAFFTRTEEGQQKMKQFTAQISGAFQGLGDALSKIGKMVTQSPIMDFFSKVGGAIFKFITAPLKLIAKSWNWIIKQITGVDVFAEMEESSKKALAIEQERQKLTTWWEGSVDGTTKSMRLQVNEAEILVAQLKEQASATTDVAKKQELLKQALEKQEWINAKNAEYRRRQLEIAQKEFDANDSNTDALIKLNDLKSQFAQEEQQDLNAIRGLQRQIYGSVEKGVEKLQESEESIKRIQEWADKLGVSVKVTKDNVAQLAKELETITMSLDLVPTFDSRSLQQQMYDKYKDNPLVMPVKPEIDDEQLDEAASAFTDKVGGAALEAEKKWGDLMSNLAETLSTKLADTLSTLMSDLGEALFSGDFMDMAANLLGNLADLMKQFGSALIAYGIAIQAFKVAMANPIAVIAAGAGLALAGGILSGVVNKLKATDFADGGIVYGETYARVAEYSGARNNPEVIAPLDRLKSILGDTNNTIGGKVEFEISGDKLYGVLNNRNRKVSRYA